MDPILLNGAVVAQGSVPFNSSFERFDWWKKTKQKALSACRWSDGGYWSDVGCKRCKTLGVSTFKPTTNGFKCIQLIKYTHIYIQPKLEGMMLQNKWRTFQYKQSQQSIQVAGPGHPPHGLAARQQDFHEVIVCQSSYRGRKRLFSFSVQEVKVKSLCSKGFFFFKL